jgi:hypothetical protein
VLRCHHSSRYTNNVRIVRPHFFSLQMSGHDDDIMEYYLTMSRSLDDPVTKDHRAKEDSLHRSIGSDRLKSKIVASLVANTPRETQPGTIGEALYGSRDIASMRSNNDPSLTAGDLRFARDGFSVIKDKKFGSTALYVVSPKDGTSLLFKPRQSIDRVSVVVSGSATVSKSDVMKLMKDNSVNEAWIYTSNGTKSSSGEDVYTKTDVILNKTRWESVDATKSDACEVTKSNACDTTSSMYATPSEVESDSDRSRSGGCDTTTSHDSHGKKGGSSLLLVIIAIVVIAIIIIGLIVGYTKYASSSSSASDQQSERGTGGNSNHGSTTHARNYEYQSPIWR